MINDICNGGGDLVRLIKEEILEVVRAHQGSGPAPKTRGKEVVDGLSRV